MAQATKGVGIMVGSHTGEPGVAAHGTFIGIAPTVCESLLGDPSSRSSRELRWGRNGSFRLKLDTGTWNDFESGEGGGVLALVMREERCDKSGALNWLQQHGFLRQSQGYSPERASPAIPRSSLSSQGATSQYRRTRPERHDWRETFRWIRSQTLPIADSQDHPIRMWLDRRNLWRPELPLPPSLRWIPADAPVFKRTHSGAGAIAFPLASVSAWQEAYPEVPPPTAVQLVCIAGDGDRADYQNSLGRRVEKPKFGNAKMAVWTIGDIRGDRVSVCEGTADALALAARDPDPVIATLTTPRPAMAWQRALSVFEFVTLWPDMDLPDDQGRRAGRDACVSLAQARKLSGKSIEVVGVDVGKDAADSACEDPLGNIDEVELNKFASDLEAEGIDPFEARRYASTMLR